MIRVGFAIWHTSNVWMGGINYLQNLLSALERLPDRKIEPVLFIGSGAGPELINRFRRVEIVKTGLLNLFGPYWVFSKAVQLLCSKNWLLERLLVHHDISVLSHSGYLSPTASIPAIGFIYDFQHLHFPNFFSRWEIESRNWKYAKTCRLCASVIVNSRDAMKDLALFAPSCLHKATVLPFTAVPMEETSLPGPEELEDRYQFKRPYFHVPNQFWVHKNHKIVLEALGILNASGRRAFILFTGSTRDYRRPDHFKALMTHAERLGIAQWFKVLGMVPYADVAVLMRYSEAVINPSLFEGRSTTVEEAKSMGKRIILSDIPVHREQAPPGGTFFDPQNAEALADAIWNLLSRRDPAGDQKLTEQAREGLPGRIEAFARGYQKIVLRVADPRSSLD